LDKRAARAESVGAPAARRPEAWGDLSERQVPAEARRETLTMGFLDKLLGRKGRVGTAQPKEDEAIPDAPCPHGALVPHWDQLEDMGKTDAISYYVCESCSERFSREQGQRLMAEAAERVRVSEEERAQPSEG